MLTLSASGLMTLIIFKLSEAAFLESSYVLVVFKI